AFWKPPESGEFTEVFLGCALLAAGVLAARPERGWTAIIAGDGAGGIAARSLLGGTVVAALAGALVFGIARRLQLAPESSLVVAMTGTLGGAAAFAFVLARRIDGLDATR